MEKPLKRKRKAARPRRVLFLALLAVALAAGAILFYAASVSPGKIPPVQSALTRRALITRKAEEVARIAVSRSSGEGYVLTGENGRLSVSGRPDFVMDGDKQKSLLDACAILEAEDTVYESKEEWEPHKADFGLNPPAVTVEVTYTDGKTAAFSLGAKSPVNNWNYFSLENDPGLYLASADLIDLFDQDVTVFHHIDQPLIHHQRIDSVTIQNGSGTIEAAWKLETDIADPNALSAWRMTVPYSYPCDADAMDTLVSAMEKLYLGRFVSKATEETKAQYGFLPPKRIITLHQAAGEIAAVGESGAYEITPYPESTLTLTIGTAGDDFIDYVEVGGSIYLVSTISQPLLSSLVPENTLLRQPAAISLDTIKSLTVESSGESRTYTLRRVERVLPNNELATDENGNVLMDTFVDMNGKESSFPDFEAAITALQSVTVSGRLPEGFVPEGSNSIKLTFILSDGRTRTLEAAPFDTLQDALSVDGTYLYYLPKGALEKGL
jgi:hypothetical protein